jgi:probable O-glycosylation ligase (exosortase A-associated)
MRELVLNAVVAASLILALYSAPGSVLVLNWIWFQRPGDFSFETLSTMPLFTIAIGIAVLSNLVRGLFQPRFPPILVVFIALLCWITLSAIYAYDTEVAWVAYRRFLPSMWLAPIVLFATIHDLRLLRWVLWVAAGSLALTAAKTSAILAAQGGAYLTQQISGFVGDNNVFGLVLCLVVAVLMGLRTTLPKKRWVRSLFFGSLALVLLCIVFTRSRGAFASVGIILLVGAVLSDRPARNVLLLVMLVAAAYVAIPSEYLERMSTVANLAADESAQGRFENWGLAWESALENPIFGVGPENHMVYNAAHRYGVTIRVAHSIYFQVLGELGFVGLGLYLLFVWIGLRTLYRTWRAMIPVAESNPDLAWVRDTAFWLTCGYIGYIFGSGLLNMLYIEFPWYAIFYGTMLQPLVDKELAERQKAGTAFVPSTKEKAHA